MNLYRRNPDGTATPVSLMELQNSNYGPDSNYGPVKIRNTEVLNVRISTVFLGVDHGWGDGPPILWETMAFGDIDHDDNDVEHQQRYTSEADAIIGHEEMVIFFQKRFGLYVSPKTIVQPSEDDIYKLDIGDDDD